MPCSSVVWSTIVVLDERGHKMKTPKGYTEAEWQAILEKESRMERAFEELAAFDEGEEIVNVITGERWKAGQRR